VRVHGEQSVMTISTTPQPELRVTSLVLGKQQNICECWSDCLVLLLLRVRAQTSMG